MENRIEIFLKDMTFNTRFEFLEESKNKIELEKIAAKRGIVLPAHDLAVFKGVYAYVDRMNKNKCTLPKEEVEKAIKTLIGKAVDFDHLRKRVVGHWVEAEVIGDEIIAYGVFYKGNFKEEYNDIKDLMEKDTLAISFEAWGNRNYGKDKSYSLTDIEFAGGALLMKTEPAFDGAEVIEMSKRERVLEFAKVMTPPKEYIHTGDIKIEKTDIDNLPEMARFHVYDIAGIMKLISEVDCLSCKEKGFSDVLMIDFENNKSRIKCYNCGAIMNVDLTPSAKLVKKGRKIKKIAMVQKASIDKNGKKIDSKIEPDNKNTKGVKELSMKKLLEQYKVETVEGLFQAIAKVSIDRELTADELEKAYTLVDLKGTTKDPNDTSLLKVQTKKSDANETSLINASITEDEVKGMITKIVKETKDAAEAKVKEDAAKAKDAEIAKLKADNIKIKEDLDKANAKVKELDGKVIKLDKAERDKKIKARRDELGEKITKDMKDEDILDENKFKMAKLERDNATLRAAKPEAAKKLDLTIGSKDKGSASSEEVSRSKVQDYAYPDKK